MSYPNIDRIVSAMASDQGSTHLLKPKGEWVYPDGAKLIDDEASTLSQDEVNELVGGDYDEVTERWPTLSAFVERLFDDLHNNFYRKQYPNPKG